MTERIIHIFIVFLIVCKVMAQTTISGVVTDGKAALVGVNVFVVGTIDGCLSDSLGRFAFSTSYKGEVTLKATCMGYEDLVQRLGGEQKTHLSLRMREKAMSINDVVITASSFHFGKGNNFKNMDALDVVMAGNSCGDIVAALQTLPGTQKVGEDGKLYVRGGASEECQTFINGMHVLEPYSTNVENTAVRGRFSPFLFKGINFSLGGYGGEYGQALSAVLPMETTDVASGDKLGVSTSLVDWNVGGTKSFLHSSLSFNTAFTSMGLYDKLFAQRNQFTRPYRKLSSEVQYKREFSSSQVLKSYVGYDLTSVGQQLDDRNLSLVEHNVYANVTQYLTLAKRMRLFVGVANSMMTKNIKGAVALGDFLQNFRNELHLKSEIDKSCNDRMKLRLGAEAYIRNGRFDLGNFHYRLSYRIWCNYANAEWRLLPGLFLQTSARVEGDSYSKKWIVLPRTSLSYIPNDKVQASLMLGRYSQMLQDEYLVRSDRKRSQSLAHHVILSFQWHLKGILARVEPYYKRYGYLPLLSSDGRCRLEGKGFSQGFDVYLENHSWIKRLSMTMAYSYNDSHRHYLNFIENRTPDFVSKHNLRLTAKYSMGKFIFGWSDSYASGRHFSSGTTPYYNSMDVNATYLVSPKVIIYSSFSNILGRTNIFRYGESGNPVTASRDRFFYIGIFISLKNNKAYDISNF